MIPRVNPKDFWRSFLNAWFDLGVQAYADLVSEDTGLQATPDLPEEIESGLTARKFVFGRTDLGDYRNEIKDVYGHSTGVVIHVKRALGKNILTVEDFGGKCPQVNIVTMSEQPITTNLVRLIPDTQGGVTTKKVEF